MDISVFAVFFSSLLLTTSIPPSPTPPESCSDQLVLFSPCLPYISSFPNNVTDSPRPQCCDEIASSIRSGAAVCLCYLTKKPQILGFPVNSTRVYSLPSVCRIRKEEGRAKFSLKHLCSGNTTSLPPLKSITGPGSSTPQIPGRDNMAPPPPPPPSPPPPSNPPPQRPEDDSSVPPAGKAKPPTTTPPPIPPAVDAESPAMTRSVSDAVRIYSCSLCLAITISLVYIFV
ncbi:unnamed protein product [Cuscuta campestris]|uniref:Bifunctional inhibitor/plant lipid transfer protein/seed storage helical domain-containing protein n=1 Tax=Cuscuta campestris TaxID=132261 RepID=A0A484M923_9ASTE|nr:unnamed protein product [Cuscuta campestris]